MQATKLLGIWALGSILLLLAFTAPNTFPQPRLHTADAAIQTTAYTDADIITLTNEERVKAGVPAVKYNEKLAAAAEAKANDMHARNYFAHHLPGETTWKFVNQHYNYEIAGENLALFWPTAQQAVDAWMESPGHRKNLLSPDFTEIGVSVMKVTIEGDTGYLIVQEFATPVKGKIATTIVIGSKSEGKASYYDYSLPGHPNYSKENLTAASRDYPRGSQLLVCEAGKPENCVKVKVNDYGPSAAIHPDRIIDLSSAAFKKLASTSRGVISVTVTEIK